MQNCELSKATKSVHYQHDGDTINDTKYCITNQDNQL